MSTSAAAAARRRVGDTGLVDRAIFAEDRDMAEEIAVVRSRFGGVHLLLLTGAAPALPMLIGSAINIWYNVTNIDPLLTPAQEAIFMRTVVVFNATVYPLIGGIWTWLILSLVRPLREQLEEASRAPTAGCGRSGSSSTCRGGLGLFGAGWALCAPVFLLALRSGADRVDPSIYVQLPVSFAISGLIAITHSFFALELLTQRLLYPVFFRNTRPAQTPGAVALSLRARGILLVVSAGVCPVVSLMLLALVPREAARETAAFAIPSGGSGSRSGSRRRGSSGVSSPSP